MRADLNGQLAHVKQQLERWKDLKASLPSAQERLNHENFRLRQIETCLDQMQRQIQSLESFSLAGLFESITGRKEHKLREFREELDSLQTDRDEATAALVQVDTEVRHIEQQLTGLGDPQRAMQDLCDRKQQQILDSQCAAGERLRQLLGELEVLRSQRREFQKAVQIGRHVMDRLETMAGALGRAKGKMIHGGALGVIGNAAVNSIVGRGSDALVARAGEKLGEFSACIVGLDLSEGTDLDIEISRLATVMGGIRENLQRDFQGTFSADRSAVVPLLEQVQSVIGHIESKLARLEPVLAVLEAQRIDLIEQV